MELLWGEVYVVCAKVFSAVTLLVVIESGIWTTVFVEAGCIIEYPLFVDGETVVKYGAIYRKKS